MPLLGWRLGMGDIGMFSGLELLIRHGLLTARSESIAYVENLDGFSYVDALTGKRCFLAVETFVAMLDSVLTTQQESLVELGICEDSTKDTAHG